MTFEIFKERYATKLVKAGAYETTEAAFADAAFNEKVAELYLALVIYAEFQQETIEKKMAEEKERRRAEAERQKIILPGGIFTS